MRALFLISFLLLALATQAQEQLHTRKSKLVEAYTKAKELVELGNLYESEEILKDVLKKDDSFDEAILLLHEVHIKRDQPETANAIISKYSPELEQKFLNRLLVIQANYHYQLGEYEQARKLLTNVNTPVYNIGSERVAFLKESIGFSIEQINSPLNIDFEKLPAPLNQFEQQYFPSATIDGRIVFTMRDRLGRGDEDLYTSYYHNNSVWSEPVSISSQINSERNEGAASISADGKTLVFTSCNRPDNIGSCDLYVSYFKNNDWTQPELLGPEVNSKAWDSQPSLTANGQTLYFVSMREGGFGKQDIWMSERVGDSWIPAINLGPSINTVEDDCSPFIYLDGETLIFSTRGRVGLGGYDLFKSTKQMNDWSVPENLGSPINNAFDQVGYCISYDQWAYFSSSDESGNIFLQRFRVPEKLVPEVVLEQVYFGRVIDAQTGGLISANVFLIEGPDSLFREVNDDGLFELQKKPSDRLYAQKKGYWNNSLSYADFLNDSTIRMTPIDIGQNLLDDPIEFDFNSHEITKASYQQLDGIVSLLKRQPELVIEITGHTDSIGDAAYNQTLSEERAKAVFNYLVNHSIFPKRLSFKGYGEKMPVEPTAAGSTLSDRRVEIRVKGIM